MAAPAGGGEAVGTLILIIILVSLVRGCDGGGGRRTSSAPDPRIHELHRSVESLRTQNERLMAAHEESLKAAARARREAASTSGTATTGVLAYALVGGALLIISGALGTTLLALHRRKGGPNG